jgi:hypothetical protein
MKSIDDSRGCSGRLLAAAALILFLFPGCDSTAPDLSPERSGAVFVANGGNFSDQNGSVTRVNVNSGASTQGQVRDGFIQAVVPVGDHLLVLLNTFSGGRIDRVSKESGIVQASLQSEGAPRAAAILEGKAYVTSFRLDGSGVVLVVDTETGQMVDQPIPVGQYPEGIAAAGGRLFIANSGFIGDGQTVTVLDPVTRSTATVDLGCDGPRDAVAVGGGDVAIVCHGKTVYNSDFSQVMEQSDGQVVFLDASTLRIVDRINLATQVGSTGGGQAVAASDSELLVLEGTSNSIRRIDLATRAEIDPWSVPDSGTFVGLSGIAHDPGRWYVGRMARGPGGPFPDFTAAGQLLVLSEEGMLSASYATGPAPTHIAVDAD